MTEFGTETRSLAGGLTPPQAIQAERAVLAAMMLGNEAIEPAILSLGKNPFYRVAHQKIFDAIVALKDRREAVDLITVSEELRKRGELEVVGGGAYLAGVFEEATTSANVEAHARIVAEKATLRSLIKVASDIQQQCYAGGEDAATLVGHAEEAVFAISDKQVRKGLVQVGSMLKGTFEEVEAISSRKHRITGIPTHFTDLDELTLGLQPADLVVIAGRPAMGKSSFAVNIAENAAIRTGTTVAIFSLEMSASQLMLRLLGSQSGVALHKIRGGFLSNADWADLTAGAGLLSRAPIWIDDTAAPTILELRAKCRRLKAEAGLGLVIIDYLQMIQAVGRPENRVQEISQITRSLKAMAKELNVPVVALSQLSRSVEQRGGADKRPQLSDLRESGTIEQDSDLVMFVYREEYYKPDDPAARGKAEIILAKHRNGPTGAVTLTFIREQTKFVDHAVIMPGESEPGF